MVVLLVLGYGLLGLAVGSVLNLVIDRAPDKLPLRGPREGEPAPPVSWLGLGAQPWLLRRGRSATGHRLPARWARVEVLTGVAFGLLGGRYGDSLVVVPLLVLASCLIAVSVTDLQVLRIPDRITFPALAISTVLVVLVSLERGVGDAIRGALVGLVAYFLLLLLPHLAYPKGMGFGDVKLALVMGLHLGWLGWTADAPVAGPVRLVLYALILGCVLGVAFGIAVAIASRRRGAFPFGPALALACFVVVAFAQELRF